jgi:hypothetical protein
MIPWPPYPAQATAPAGKRRGPGALSGRPPLPFPLAGAAPVSDAGSADGGRDGTTPGPGRTPAIFKPSTPTRNRGGSGEGAAREEFAGCPAVGGRSPSAGSGGALVAVAEGSGNSSACRHTPGNRDPGPFGEVDCPTAAGGKGGAGHRRRACPAHHAGHRGDVSGRAGALAALTLAPAPPGTSSPNPPPPGRPLRTPILECQVGQPGIPAAASARGCPTRPLPEHSRPAPAESRVVRPRGCRWSAKRPG